MKMKCFYTDEPPRGKFIAFFSDGSGCDMFKWDVIEQHYIRADGELNGMDEHWFVDAGFCLWAALPNKFQFWCELTSTKEA